MYVLCIYRRQSYQIICTCYWTNYIFYNMLHLIYSPNYFLQQEPFLSQSSCLATLTDHGIACMGACLCYHVWDLGSITLDGRTVDGDQVNAVPAKPPLTFLSLFLSFSLLAVELIGRETGCSSSPPFPRPRKRCQRERE
jgi:hypothetical protein